MQASPALAYNGKAWKLTHDPSRYLFGAADKRDYEADVAGLGRSFPHLYGPADDNYFTAKLTLGPAGDELTLDFAKMLLDKEQLWVRTRCPISWPSASRRLTTSAISSVRQAWRRRTIWCVVWIVPWRYDTYVPVIFAGAGLSAATVNRAVTPYEIAPTIATYLKIKPPSGSIGTGLQAVLDR